jgi:hypothetical protein
MLNDYERVRIWPDHYLKKKSVPGIAKEERFCHQAIEKALFDPLHYTGAPLDDILYCLHRLSEATAAPPQASEYTDQSTRPVTDALRFFPTMNSC